MKEIVVLFLFSALLLPPKLGFSQHTMRVGNSIYPSTSTWRFKSSASFGPQVNVTVGKRNNTGLLLLSSESNISGTVYVYLENNEVITCYERKRDRFDARNYTLYYFTENEVRKLIRYNIDFIRLEAATGFTSRKETYTARNETNRSIEGRFIKTTYNTAEEIRRLFRHQSSSQNFRIHINTTNSFSIEYPRTWTEFPMQGFTFAALNEGTAENMNVLVINNVTMPLDRVTESNIAELKRNIRDLKILNETSGVINGKRFTLTESTFYNHLIPGNQYTAIYCFVENHKAYIVTFATEYNARQSLKVLMNDIIETMIFFK